MSGDRYKIHDQHETYFCTLTVVHWIDLFTRVEYKDIIVRSLNYCIKNKGLELYAWVIMSNHIHLVGRTQEPHRFSDFLRDFKKFVSKSLIKEILDINESRKEWLLDKFSFEAKRTRRAEKYKVWQDSNHAIMIDRSINVWEKINYIHENPASSRIVDQASDYIYSSARDFEENRKGLVEIIAL